MFISADLAPAVAFVITGSSTVEHALFFITPPLNLCISTWQI